MENFAPLSVNSKTDVALARLKVVIITNLGQRHKSA